MFKIISIFLLSISILSCRKDNSIKPLTLSTEFIVVGHAYGNPLVFQLNLYHKLIPALYNISTYMQPNRYIFTGDVVAKATEENWTNVLNEFDSLGIEYWIAPGNHDLGSDYFVNHIQNQKHFSVRENRILYLILNTNYSGWTVNNEQISLLTNELAHLEEIDNIFVFSHQVWWAKTENAALEFDSIPTNSQTLANGSSNFWTDAFSLFEGIDKPIYFISGDIGCLNFIPAYQEKHFDNMHFYASGIGGGKDDNFLYVSVSNSGKVKIDKINF